MYKDDLDLLKKIITVDESWVYGYDIKTKAQTSQWKSPEEPRPKKGSVKCGSFAQCFLRLQWRGASCILATKLYGQVNKEYYLEVLRRLSVAIHQKRTEL